MKEYCFSSCIKQKMRDFVTIKQLSGNDYHSQIQLLSYFDKFLLKKHYNKKYLTKDIVQSYLNFYSYLSPRGYYNRYSIVKQFCCYLNQSLPNSHIPEQIRPIKSTYSFKPYIYSKTEIKSILKTAMGLPPQKTLRPHTYYTLFGLLYTTGIRIGEARALDIDDFYPDSNLLLIREGKFRKSRWILLSDSTAHQLKIYLNKRKQINVITSDSPLFISLHRKRLAQPTVNSAFSKVLKQCNIHTKTGKSPRLHDLRHGFAVHCLIKWYKEKKNVNSLLPVLATYMGHVDIGSTQVYLHPTAELLNEGNQRFLQYFREKIK